MNAIPGRPDQLSPGSRRLQYAFFCWMNRHPSVWRFIGSVLRRWSFISHVVPMVARKSAVKHVLLRPKSFSNNSHLKNLIADDFQIGMDPGFAYDQDKALFDQVLKTLKPQEVADAEAKNRIEKLKSGNFAFDLIEDYLTWVVYEVILKGFGQSAESVVANVKGSVPDECEKRRYLYEIRYVAAHLFAGYLAPIKIQRRAEMCARALRDRIDTAFSEIGDAWSQGNAKADKSVIRRTAIGYTWVSHPVTVQSGALAFQELMSRPKVYKRLCVQAKKLGDDAWTSEEFRSEVQNHVLELMRFRPIFPLLSRDAPRHTEIESGAYTNSQIAAGSSVTILSIAAMFDSSETPAMDKFCPHRKWGSEESVRYMMFGYGDRQCPAKNHAVTMITSAFIGLLLLGRLQWADRWGAKMQYDGPMISRMRMKLSKSSN
jgi:cytochrome P450